MRCGSCLAREARMLVASARLAASARVACTSILRVGCLGPPDRYMSDDYAAVDGRPAVLTGRTDSCHRAAQTSRRNSSAGTLREQVIHAIRAQIPT
jgi:hypothetical protein